MYQHFSKGMSDLPNACQISPTLSVSTGMRQLELKMINLDEYSTTEQTMPLW